MYSNDLNTEYKNIVLKAEFENKETRIKGVCGKKYYLIDWLVDWLINYLVEWLRLKNEECKWHKILFFFLNKIETLCYWERYRVKLLIKISQITTQIGWISIISVYKQFDAWYALCCTYLNFNSFIISTHCFLPLIFINC